MRKGKEFRMNAASYLPPVAPALLRLRIPSFVAGGALSSFSLQQVQVEDERGRREAEEGRGEDRVGQPKVEEKDDGWRGEAGLLSPGGVQDGENDVPVEEEAHQGQKGQQQGQAGKVKCRNAFGGNIFLFSQFNEAHQRSITISAAKKAKKAKSTKRR